MNRRAPGTARALAAIASLVFALLVAPAHAGDATAARDQDAAPAPAKGLSPTSLARTRARNVVLVMIDGLRWQEVFSGADEAYMNKESGKVEKPEPLREKWIRPTPEERRELLMPFLWGTIAKQGQVFGNQDKGSTVRITNGIGVSYPGYAETLCGIADPIIKDNRHIVNPNQTVLEWINKQPGFESRVAAFGSWDTFRFIFRADACGFPVDDGTGPFTKGTLTPEIELVNRMRQEIPYRWGSVAFDAMLFNVALPWIKANKPRAVFVGLGETDEWAHEYDYAGYLRAAHLADGYLKTLWETLQSMDEYRGCTTMIVNPDHGRGDLRTSARDWGDHGASHPGSENIWMAVMGPDTQALGERTNVEPVTQNQIAATYAAFLGLDFGAAEPRAGKAIPAVLPR